jgi:signal transduction histidine kinase
MKEVLKRREIDYSFMEGGGEMGALMRAKDWSLTPVGPVEFWPQSLKSTVRNILRSKFAMWLWWGTDLVQFYNDAYRPSLGKTGEKHPHALGEPGQQTWGEIWPIIKPQIDQVMETGEATWNINHLVPIYRNNILEEVYWTYSYSPVYDDNDVISGVLVTVTETSQQVISERQLLLLKELAAKTLHARTVKDACTLALEALDTNRRDIPFSLLYLTDEANKKVELVACTGLTGNEYQAGKTYLPDNTVWPFATVMETGKPVVTELNWSNAANKSVVLPLVVAGHAKPRGFLIMGLNPMRLYDENYISFTNLITNHISSAIANADVWKRLIESEAKYKLLSENLEELVKERTYELERSNEDLQQFAHVASHDLKEPVRKIKVFTNLMETQFGNVLPPAGKSYLQKVHTSADRMKAMIDGVLQYSSVGNHISEESTPVDLNEILKGVEKELELLLHEKQGVIQFSPMPMVDGIHILLYQLFYNLINNSLKFSKVNVPPVIEISTTLHSGNNTVTVHLADNGIGFDVKNIEKIFNPFTRLNAKEEYEGNGLGLALCKKIVERHGGQITAESKPGAGSVFHVTLPLVQINKNKELHA